ncbi:quercetin dioxygenase-like cupin family protein [Povalibacter uvarum]|uniref:Quercetin dioxygenase-like cupin family protein n=1 Tax=Povalibacter uvarum TaxID=732238 RepID=A0A841HJQ9_9GAMM|nr:cupin domain-containing protein [Povalibacter uvarum]MBB6092619.1 quercetin dioxygenase-like cupin family protein [Povalibacter uvarum]
MNLIRTSTLAAAALLSFAAPAAEPPSPAKVTPLLTKALPDLPGKEGMMLTVEYAPGGASPSHRHNAHTFVYVLEGNVVMQVAGGKEMTLKVGDTFYEAPTDIHSVSRNASDSQPAKLLVFFIKDAGAPVSMPVK